MRSNFDVDSIVTTRRLVEVRKNYFIPPEYELYAPLSGEHPYDAFPSGFNLTTNALDASLRFPLHPVVEACLKGWQISPSQMAPNLWSYLMAFLWECYGLGIVLEQEVGVLRSSLDGAWNDRARLEGDVLSLAEVATFLEAELKVDYELGLEKIGRVNYEFGYRVAPEQLRGKYPEIAIERNPFVECHDDANVEMDLNHPFDDSAPSEK
ncbi:hypothetical protein BHE74_00024940 [Ensete ventricosum]|nr:hypothetical protein GW17_00054442 [Ensete ventricosum]RWW67606.1 hypothetical protein BHE74_00024940 [Ensete ventricosum]RZS13340.1 hypothetical protein BHM03_00044909 [Ensete ventricosum]